MQKLFFLFPVQTFYRCSFFTGRVFKTFSRYIILYIFLIHAQAIYAQDEILESYKGNGQEKVHIPEYSVIAPREHISLSDSIFIVEHLGKKSFEKIKHYIFQYGPILHRNEILFIHNITSHEAEFLKRMEIQSQPKTKKYLEKQLELKYQTRINDEPWQTSYQFVKAQYSNRSLNAGILIEKDAYESIKKTNAYFSSSYLELNSTRIHFIVGDYKLNWGQGLSIWQGFSLKNDITQTSFRKTTGTIKPNRSKNKFQFLRGLYAEYTCNPRFHFSLMLSRKLLNAKIYGNDQKHFTSIDKSGKYISSKDRNVQESIYGGRLKYNHRNIAWSIYHWQKHLNIPYMPEIFHKKLHTSGRYFSNTGLCYQSFHKWGNIYGEALLQNNLKPAFSGGLLIQLLRSQKLGIHLNILPPSYFQTYASAATRFQNASGEKSLAINYGLVNHYDRKWILAFNIFHYHWFRYQIHNPSQGQSIESYFQTKQGPWSMFFKIKTSKTFNPIVSFRNNLSFRTLLSLDKNELQTRVMVSKTSNQTGWLMFLQHSLRFSKFYIHNRLTRSIIDGFDSRIYLYEHALSQSQNIQMHYRSKWSYYGLMNYYLNHQFKMRIKWHLEFEKFQKVYPKFQIECVFNVI